MKDNLLVSFSGGETSAYMAYWISKKWVDKYNIRYVFANTGEEHENTLKFIEKCSEYFGININWVEAVYHGYREGTTHKKVDFKTASRNGKPFEEMIKKYGIPNQSFKHCSRSLKLEPINHFVKHGLGWDDYYSAIGIRVDEIDRIRPERKKLKLLYPLAEDNPMNKQKINFWWSQQPFRLDLKGYEGNCKTCWKKSDKKLFKIAQENPTWFDNFALWEHKYGRFYPPSQKNRPKDKPITFFRNHRSAKDILEQASQLQDLKVVDDHSILNYQTSIFDEEESCEIYAECGK